MHKLPVDAKILQVALEILVPPDKRFGWYVDGGHIGGFGHTLWSQQKGICSATAAPFSCTEAVTHLLKSRLKLEMPGWEALDGWQREQYTIPRRDKIGLEGGSLWPEKSKTGAQYVEACAWYDRVEAELAAKAAPEDPQRIAIATHADLMAALEQATPYELSDVSKVRDLVQPLVPVYIETAVEVNADNPRLYDIILRAGVETETVHWPIPRGTTGCIGDRVYMELATEKDAKSAQTVRVPSHLLRAEDIPHAPEQPWEKQARVAASAGYAHMAVENDWCVEHASRMRLIREGLQVIKAYAHQPSPAPLSGTRSVNGWAVSGFAVTDGSTQHWGNGRWRISKVM